MSKERPDIKTVFCKALEKKSLIERNAYLQEACGKDNKLRAEVEELLKANDAAGSFLNKPAADLDNTQDMSKVEKPGTVIGRYKLLELIGEGGMGLVYLAEQKEPVRRKMALKIVKLGMDTKQVVARFEAERQVLALLDHPNIARVFDAGATDTGRPYFVMEYVKGMSITSYCDYHKLGIEQRLKLFLQACYGIQHAHQKGIIHRDIKPSNILVSVQDDRGLPKIIDFGIAKAVTQPLTEQTLFTRQDQLIGTPEYMSPEQAEMANQDIDIRADIYSLGMVLYELLTGVLPFDHDVLKNRGFIEVQKILREQEPPHPSIRLTNLGERAKTIAASRNTQVVTLARRLHRELEWIPLKAMRKDRSRRYRSASELADDIRNYLDSAPLIAGPETAVYRVKKFVQKHAGSVATVALVVVAIILGLVISATMYFQAEKARGIAEEARSAEAKQRQIAEEETKRAKELAETQRKQLYFNHIALANASYRDSNIPSVRELLESCPEDLRGWEWHRLNYISDQSLMTLSGHDGLVYDVAFSPDGRRIVSAGMDNTIKVWNAATGAEVMTLRGHKDSVSSVAFSPDGKRIVSASADKAIKVWNAATGVEVTTLRGHEDDVDSVAFSPNGKHIVSGSDDHTIKVWDATTGTELMTLRGIAAGVHSVSFSPDGKRIVSGSRDKTVKVWDAATGTEVMTLRGHEGSVRCVSFSPDGRRIVSCSRDNTVKVWNATTGTELMTLRGHEEAIFTVAFSPDSKQIITGSVDRTIKVWDAASGDELMTLRGHEEFVQTAVFSPNGKRIVSGSYDSTIRVWDTTINRDCMTLRVHAGRIGPATFSPDGRRIVSPSVDKTIKVWDASTGAELMALRGHDSPVWSVAFSPDGKRIVSGSFDGMIKIWDSATGAELMILRGHDDRVWSVAFSPNGKRIVSGSYDSTIRVWDAATGDELMTLLGHDAQIEAVAYSPDGKHIISGSWDNTVKVWDAETGDELMTLIGHEKGIPAVAFSPDGKRIVSGSSDNTVKVWNAETGAEMMTLSRHKGRVRSVVFSPDGRRIVSISGDSSNNKTMKVWDAATGAEVMTIWTGRIRSVAFSPDGKTIAISDESGIKLLESEVPVNGYEARRAGAAAREVVDELYEEHGLYSEVINKLKADNTIDKAVRKIALQITNARLWEDTEKQKKQTQDPTDPEEE